MKLTLTKNLEQFVEEKVRSGRYSDASDVVRDALRALEQRDGYESPALERALLEGVNAPHHPYTATRLQKIRKAARAVK